MTLAALYEALKIYYPSKGAYVYADFSPPRKPNSFLRHCNEKLHLENEDDVDLTISNSLIIHAQNTKEISTET